MDNCINVNTTYETDSRSPLKELYQKNNKPAELCDNQNKNVHLFDMETSFLQNTVMIPNEFDADQSTDSNVSVNSNRENERPRYSVLNTFDPIIQNDSEQVKSTENSTLNSKLSFGENNLNAISDNKIFVNDIIENESVAIAPTELNQCSVSNLSDNSVLNSTVVLNKSLTVENKIPDQILVDKSLLNASSLKTNQLSPVSKSNDSLTDQNSLLSSTLNLELSSSNNTIIIEKDTFDGNDSLIKAFSEKLVLESEIQDSKSSEILNEDYKSAQNSVLENTVIEKVDISIKDDNFVKITSEKAELDPEIKNPSSEILTVENKVLLNVSSLKTNQLSPVSKSDNFPIEQNLNVLEQNSLNNTGRNSLLSSTLNSESSTFNNEFITTVIEKETSINISENKDNSKSLETSSESYKTAQNSGVENQDDGIISEETNIDLLHTVNDLIEDQNEKVSNEQNIECNESKLNLTETIINNLSIEIISEEKLPTEKLFSEIIVDTTLEEKLIPEVTQEEKPSPEELILEEKSFSEEKLIPEIALETRKEEIIPELVQENISSQVIAEEQISAKFNEVTTVIHDRNENIASDLNKTIDKIDNSPCLEKQNVSLDVTYEKSNAIEFLNDFEENLTKEKPNIDIVLNSTYENKTIESTDQIIASNTVILQEIHMSASEPNSAIIEPAVASRLSLENTATCTNDMGEIINQNEIYEKQSDISNGAIDNKESLEAKVRVFNEMAEKCAVVEAECEKYKVQVADLKKELKICRQKTITLEAEVADLKRRENELNVLLEDYKESAAKKSNSKDQDEQLQCLQVSEEALKNEVKELKALLKQHETHLKELQRKEVKLADDLSCKTQSEMQISRVMEEYEKSISSLISENEKMKKERDTAQMHLANIEMAFSDVHQKYERCKAIVQGYKDNEESFKQDIAMNRETIVIQEQKYETLKAHAMAQLEKSNQELAAMKKQHETEMARLTAQLKRYEIKNMSLMESLQQKAKECEQLSAVCDEFIGNV